MAVQTVSQEVEPQPTAESGSRHFGITPRVAFLDGRTLTRRAVLRAALAFTGAGLSASLLAACGGDDDDDDEQPTATTAAAAPTATTELAATSAPGSTPAPSEPTATTAAAATATAPATGTVLADEQVLRVAWWATDDLDPNTNTHGSSGFVFQLIYDSLLWIGEDPEPVLLAAESWEISDDAKLYTFSLREGMQWTDGTPVTAGDFAYSLQRGLDPTLAAGGAADYYPIVGAEEYNTGASTDFATVGARAVDDLTFEIELTDPSVWYVRLLAGLVPIPQWAVEEHGAQWVEPGKHVSNGPFMVESFLPTQELVLVRNENYWGDAPTLERIEFKIALNLANLPAYQNDEVDLSQINEADIDLVEGDDTLSAEYVRISQDYVQLMVVNTREEPLSNPEVRTALALAIDYDSLVNEAFRGLAELSPTYIPEGTPGYNPDAAPTGGAEEARRLLAEAGFPDGEGFPNLTMTTWAENQYETVAVVAQQMWQEQLNINVEVERLEAAAYRAWRGSLADGTVPFNFYFVGHQYTWKDPAAWHVDAMTYNRGNNGWENAEFDDLVAQASAETDPAKRQELHEQAEAIVLAELPLIPTHKSPINALIKPWVTGLRRYPFGYTRYLTEVSIAKH